MLVETDTPYLAPVPYRGKPNRPAYVVEVARRLAEETGETCGGGVGADGGELLPPLRQGRRRGLSGPGA